MSFNRRSLMGSALLLFFLGGSLAVDAAAADIRVDFNNAATTPNGWYCVGDPSDGATVHKLTDYYTGQETGVTLQLVDAFKGSTNNQNVAWSNSSAPWVDLLAMRDYAALGIDDFSARIVISGLDDVSTCTIELLSYRDNDTTDTSYLVNGAAGVIIDGGGSTATWNAKDDGFTNQDFMQWSAVTPDINGQVVIDVSTVGNYAFLNGMRLAYVPEPSSAILLLSMAVGVGWLTGTRRRRKRE